MNEDLEERFGRGKNTAKNHRSQTTNIFLLPSQLNPNVRTYFHDAPNDSDAPSWLSRDEIPSSDEVMEEHASDASRADRMKIVPNKPEGAWESKGTNVKTDSDTETYLEAQYALAREEAVRPIREAVSRVRNLPGGDEDAFDGKIGIYEKAHICALTYSTRGIAVKLTFSLARSQKKIIWAQSKRLISGSLIILTPKDDMFKHTAVVATVASRSIAGVLKDPPELDLFIARADELEIDPAKEWVMVEDRSSYFEAGRHTLLGLQKMAQESAEPHIPAPQYLTTRPIMDLTVVLQNEESKSYDKVDVLNDWPAQPSSALDASQLAALQRALTKQLAIIQGPPGTGKTFVSVQAIKVLLANWRVGDPPIIIACQTNHAVDQILRHIASFTSDFVRLGGRSKDRDVIFKRTLQEVRIQSSTSAPAGSLGPAARKKMKALEQEMQADLSPLRPDQGPMDPALLVRYNLLSEKQLQSLGAGASSWNASNLSDPSEVRNNLLNQWIGGSLTSVPARQPPDHATSNFVYEAAELEIEQLREMETENVARDDEDFDNLYGETCPLVDNFTCHKLPGVMIATTKIEEALCQDDMWKIPDALRGAIYRYLQTELKKRILDVIRPKAKAYDKQIKLRRIGGFERDEIILKQQKIIGMTTTGLSKYRGLLAALSPKIVLIEEAAETLEAPVTVACVPSVQQLILVGDHRQLRPHCQVKLHERDPIFLDISLFERMINNKVEYTTLVMQRRMIPEIRRLLFPIYDDAIIDHEDVLDKKNRPDVPGMGGINSFWFSHRFLEDHDPQMSMFNPEEAEMVVGMVEHLCYNGMESKHITVLTFYNGQRQQLLRALRQKLSLAGQRFNVVTVDSYQGEENEIVLLSLVRSNAQGSIGFSGIDNRICVALSRARRGFYIFGNGELLQRVQTWRTVLRIMAGGGPVRALPKLEGTRLTSSLVVTCTNHGNTVAIREPCDWDKITGGCENQCGARLACGHTCPITCHPFSHDYVFCEIKCTKTLSCGHTCSKSCSKKCFCKLCSNKAHGNVEDEDDAEDDQDDGDEGGEESIEGARPGSNKSSWQSFATAEPRRYAIAASAPAPRTSFAQKTINSQAPTGIAPADSGSTQVAPVQDRPQQPVALLEPQLVKLDIEEDIKGEESATFQDWSKADSLLD
nr:helicase required for rnai-mediated heterochromatin assembly 1 [Quercus suber]